MNYRLNESTGYDALNGLGCAVVKSPSFTDVRRGEAVNAGAQANDEMESPRGRDERGCLLLRRLGRNRYMPAGVADGARFDVSGISLNLRRVGAVSGDALRDDGECAA